MATALLIDLTFNTCISLASVSLVMPDRDRWDMYFSVPHVQFSFSFQEDRGSDNEDQKQERNEDSAGDEKTD